MTSTPDFSKLYAQLNLRPDCSLEDFKHAYRRKVAALHPDRRIAGDNLHGEERIPLSDLMSLYGVAMQFQKEHGRLPGAPVSGKIHGAVRPPREMPQAQTPAWKPGKAQDDALPSKSWLLLAVLIGLVVYLVISATPRTPADTAMSARQEVTPKAAASPVPTDRHRIALGMDATTVLSIQGTPSRTSEELWEYGPSWIRFKEGRVVGWYSSPLYRLRSPGQQAPGKRPSER